MKLISIINKGLRFLLRVFDNYSKYLWVDPLKYKNGVSINNDFQKILNVSSHKSNKIWVYKRSKFYNRSIKSWLQDSDIEMS